MAPPSERQIESYKAQWAQYVAQQTLKADVKAVEELVQKVADEDKEIRKKLPDLPADSDATLEMGIGQLLNVAKELTGLGYVPPAEETKFKVGIVGAGAAGLFTAMVFDWLNSEVNKDIEKESEKLKIDYDIFEAAGEDRLGGRLYTHRFSDKKHDYYDVGAMRFPNNYVMKRTFQLFKYIGLEKELIPYYMTDVHNVCPTYFNDVHYTGNVYPKEDKAKAEDVDEDEEKCGIEEKKEEEKTKEGEVVFDPYNLNSGLPSDDLIHPSVLGTDPSKIVEKALAGIIKKTKKLYDEFRNEEDKEKKKEAKERLCNFLMKADKMSVRQFLGSGNNGCEKDDLPHGKEYNYNTIEWLETATYGTGWYDQALTECVLEELDFGTPDDGKNHWYCIDGGAQTIARKMAEKIEKKVQFHSKVETIDANMEQRRDGTKSDYVPMTLKIKQSYPDAKATFERSRDYFAVFNSTTLAATQRMDLKNAGLLWGTKQAIRSLGYGASCKVAIKFKSPWWQVKPFNINEGGIGRTDLPLRVCVYPSYNIQKLEGSEWSDKESSVLLCSYTWGQDAQRLGSLISPNTPENEGELLKTLLHNLALLHANKDMGYEELLQLLYREYDTHHAWDWYRDQNMSGAFAYFGPGQFSNMWEEIIKPNAFGQLYFVGEAASSHHAWVVGALESVLRAVYFMFEGLSSQRPHCEAFKKALKLLTHRPQDPGAGPLPSGLPFYPLPDDVPLKQADVPKGDDQTADPRKIGDHTHLYYTTATASLALLESYFQLVSCKTA